MSIVSGALLVIGQLCVDMLSIALVAFMIVWFCGSAWSFTALVRELHESHREAWVMAGRPDSFPFYSPPGSSGQTRWEAFKLMVSWSFNPPAWTGYSARARCAVVVLRLCLLATILWIVSLLVLVLWNW